MRLACDSCGARYRLADEKVRGRLVEVRCRACTAVLTLRDGVPVPAVPPKPPRLWFALIGGEQLGPLPDDAFERQIAEGRILASTFVWHEGMAEWKRLSEAPR